MSDERDPAELAELQKKVLAWTGEVIQYGLNLEDRAEKVAKVLGTGKVAPIDLDEVCDGKFFCALALSIDPKCFKSVRPAVRGRIAQFQGFCRDQGVADTDLICPPDVWPLPAKYPAIVAVCLEGLAKVLAGKRATCSVPRLAGVKAEKALPDIIGTGAEPSKVKDDKLMNAQQVSRPMMSDMSQMGVANAAATLHVVDEDGRTLRKINLCVSKDEDYASVGERADGLNAVDGANKQVRLAASASTHAEQAALEADIVKPVILAPAKAMHESPDAPPPAPVEEEPAVVAPEEPPVQEELVETPPPALGVEETPEPKVAKLVQSGCRYQVLSKKGVNVRSSPSLTGQPMGYPKQMGVVVEASAEAGEDGWISLKDGTGFMRTKRADDETPTMILISVTFDQGESASSRRTSLMVKGVGKHTVPKFNVGMSAVDESSEFIEEDYLQVAAADGFDLYVHEMEEDEKDLTEDVFDASALPMIKGKMWKKSPSSWRLTSYDRRYFIVRDMHIFWWASKKDAAQVESRAKDGGPLLKGSVNLVLDACQIECDSSDPNRFYLRPRGNWSQGKYGDQTGGRTQREFGFDCSNSEHPRSEWLKVIYEHIEHGDRVRAQIGMSALRSKDDICLLPSFTV